MHTCSVVKNKANYMYMYVQDKNSWYNTAVPVNRLRKYKVHLHSITTSVGYTICILFLKCMYM